VPTRILRAVEGRTGQDFTLAGLRAQAETTAQPRATRRARIPPPITTKKTHRSNTCGAIKSLPSELIPGKAQGFQATSVSGLFIGSCISRSDACKFALAFKQRIGFKKPTKKSSCIQNAFLFPPYLPFECYSHSCKRLSPRKQQDEKKSKCLSGGLRVVKRQSVMRCSPYTRNKIPRRRIITLQWAGGGGSACSPVLQPVWREGGLTHPGNMQSHSWLGNARPSYVEPCY